MGDYYSPFDAKRRVTSPRSLRGEKQLTLVQLPDAPYISVLTDSNFSKFKKRAIEHGHDEAQRMIRETMFVYPDSQGRLTLPRSIAKLLLNDHTAVWHEDEFGWQIWPQSKFMEQRKNLLET